MRAIGGHLIYLVKAGLYCDDQLANLRWHPFVFVEECCLRRRQLDSDSMHDLVGGIREHCVDDFDPAFPEVAAMTAHVCEDRFGLLNERDEYPLFDLLVDCRVNDAVAQVHQ
jgi:hypothetical protein